MTERSVEASGAIEAIAARTLLGYIGRDGQWRKRDGLSTGPRDARYIAQYGTAAHVETMIEALEAAIPAAEMADRRATWLRDMADPADVESLPAPDTATALERAIALLTLIRDDLANIEAELAELGQRWDAKRSRLQWTPEGKKPTDYITAAIREAWWTLRPIYRREADDSTRSAQVLREWIAEALRYLPDDLDPGPGGLIDETIGNIRTARRR